MPQARAELGDLKPTPFTLLFAIYNARLALRVPGFVNLTIQKQCEYLQRDKIYKKPNRATLIQNLIEQEKDFTELSHKAYIRIHIKYILALYHKLTQKLRTDQDIASWTKHEIILSFICHLITESATDESQNKKNTAHDKIWEFVHYLWRYFNDTDYNGHTFLSTFSPDQKSSNKPTKGFGLQMMKTVCSKYSLKSGPFSKVKKQCNVWATAIQQQAQGIVKAKPQKQQPQSNNTGASSAASNTYNSSSKPHNYSKFVTDVSMYVNQQQPVSNNDNLTGKKWYWFNDNAGFRWMPYREIDMQKLNTAWRNNQKSCLIINGQYRVEFSRNNPDRPMGNQYNNSVQNAGGRSVICSEPKSEISGITVSQNPL